MSDSMWVYLDADELDTVLFILRSSGRHALAAKLKRRAATGPRRQNIGPASGNGPPPQGGGK